MLKSLSKDEIKEVLQKVREIEQRDPSRFIMCWILGIDSAPEGMSVEQAEKFIMDVFPSKQEKK